MNLTRTRAMVLSGKSFREADKILEFYSDDYGKIRAVAKGVRKIKSKLGGHLEPFTDVDLMLAKGRGELWTVTGAKAVTHYPGMRRNLQAVAVASYLAELVGRLSPDAQANQWFPDLLRTAFSSLEAGHDPNRVVAYYEWQSIMLAGWEQDLRHCTHCRQRLYPQGLSYSTTLGGVLCKECADEDRQALAISPDVVKLLRCYAERPFGDVQGLLVGKSVWKETKQVSDRVVRQILEREPKSRAFLETMETV